MAAAPVLDTPAKPSAGAAPRGSVGRRLVPPRAALAARKFFYFLHLWIGLILGLYFTVMGFTGCLLLFQSELDAAFHPALFRVSAPAGAERRSLDELAAAVTARYPGQVLSSLTLPQAPDESLRVELSPAPTPGAAAGQQGPGGPGGPGQQGPGGRAPRQQVFVDPYTGAILGERQGNGTFFPTVHQLHEQLLLRQFGYKLNSYGVLFLIVLLVSGLWLWWPSVRDFGRQFRQRVTIKRGASVKRLLFDLHNAIGFWASALLLVITITAASHFWRAPTVTIVSALSGTPMVPQQEFGEGGPGGFGGPGGRQGGGPDRGPGGGFGGAPGQTPAAPQQPQAQASYATLLANAQKVFPKLPVLQIQRGGGGRGGRGGGRGRGGGNGIRIVKAWPWADGVRPRLITINADPATGELTGVDVPSQSPLGLRVMAWLMPIHEGQWGYGPFFYVVKALHCLAGLMPSVLFVTGVCMWWNKKRGKMANRKRHRLADARAAEVA